MQLHLFGQSPFVQTPHCQTKRMHWVQALQTSQVTAKMAPVQKLSTTVMQKQKGNEMLCFRPRKIRWLIATCPRCTAECCLIGMALSQPPRVGKDVPAHPPLKGNGHHCDISCVPPTNKICLFCLNHCLNQTETKTLYLQQ